MSWSGDPRRDIDASPAVSLPPMLRRRLNASGRAVCRILAELDPAAEFPLIHASRHGDADRTLKMLTALAEEQDLSPAHFSMSVHNAILGIHSIAHHHRQPMQALGANGDEFDALMDEAYGYLLEGMPAVVAVFSEGSLPEAYRAHAEAPPAACAVGIRLTLAHGRALLADTAANSPRHPTPLDVSAWLHGNPPFLDGRRRWRLGGE